MLKDLERITFGGNTTLNKTIVSCPVQAGGVSIIISDFLDKGGIEEAVRYLAYRKQTIVLIQILSKEEMKIWFMKCCMDLREYCRNCKSGSKRSLQSKISYKPDRRKEI